ncbi:MAG: TIGR03089 family protein [Jatrophihabitantaceae bacterium]
MHQLTTPEGLFGAILAADPGRPFVTYYDEATGERSELSRKSLANWVAKTHFLLLDELGLGVGDTAVLGLPAHWISVPAVLGCLTAGLALAADGAGAAVAFVEPARAALAVGLPDAYAVAPDSAAVGLGDAVAPGLSDYVTAVRPQPDAWASVRMAAGPADPGIGGLSRGEVVERARARADELGVGEGGRILSTRDWRSPADWIDTVVVPIVCGASVIFVRNPADGAVVERRAAQERATVRL